MRIDQTVCDLCGTILEKRSSRFTTSHKLPAGREDDQFLFQCVTSLGIPMTAGLINVDLCPPCAARVMKRHVKTLEQSGKIGYLVTPKEGHERTQ
jgi:hypothetical protein